MNKIVSYLILIVSLIGFTSCSSFNDGDCSQKNDPEIEGDFFMKLTNLAGKTADGSDKCNDVLLMIFDSTTGDKILEQNLAVNKEGETKVIGIPERGAYDYYLFANTDFAGTQFKLVLESINNSKDFEQLRKVKIDTRSYTPYTLTDRKVLLYASYFNVEVGSASGTSAKNPWALNANLSRAVAKVAVKFYQNSNNIGSKRVKSINLNNVVSTLYAPTNAVYEDIYTSKIDLGYTESFIESKFDYTKDVVGTIVFYVPEMLYKANSSDQNSATIEIVVENTLYRAKVKTRATVVSEYLAFKGFDSEYQNITPKDLDLISLMRELSYEFRIKLDNLDDSHLVVTEWDKEDSDDLEFIVSPIEDFEKIEVSGGRP